MSMNIALVYEHPKGARHHVPLHQTPTEVTYRMLGHDMTKKDYPNHPPAVPPTFEEVRDRYFEWTRTNHKGFFRLQRDHINREHKLWLAAGFTPKWYAH